MQLELPLASFVQYLVVKNGGYLRNRLALGWSAGERRRPAWMRGDLPLLIADLSGRTRGSLDGAGRACTTVCSARSA